MTPWSGMEWRERVVRLAAGFVAWVAGRDGTIPEGLVDVPRNQRGVDYIVNAALATKPDIPITWVGALEIAAAQIRGGRHPRYPVARTLARLQGKLAQVVYDRHGEGRTVSWDLAWMLPFLGGHIVRVLSLNGAPYRVVDLREAGAVPEMVPYHPAGLGLGDVPAEGEWACDLVEKAWGLNLALLLLALLRQVMRPPWEA